MLEEVVNDFPKDLRARHDLAWALWSLYSHLPDPLSPESETLLRRALAIESELERDYPSVTDYRRVVAVCQAGLGMWLQGHARFQEGDEVFLQAFDHYEKLVRELPALPSDGLEIAEIWLALRPMLLESGRLDEAEKTFCKALALAQRLETGSPRAHRFRHLVALNHHALGIVLGEVGEPQEAEKAFRQALAIWSDLVKENPALEQYSWWLAWCYNDLADLFATCPAAHYHDASQAVRLAQKAVELNPRYCGFWNTLGTAHYRAGDYVVAVKELEKSMAMNNGGDCYDWFFLAMAHWRLDHKAEAREFYDRAITWMEENKGKLEKSKLQASRFRRFCAEAEDLLGIPSDRQSGKKGH